MRCIAGVIVFVVLYFGSCFLLGEIAAYQIAQNKPRYSERAARKAAARIVHEYHPYMMAATGVIAVVSCCLPSILLRMSERAERRQYAQFEEFRISPRRGPAR